MPNRLLSRFVNGHLHRVGLHLSKKATITRLAILQAEVERLQAEVERLQARDAEFAHCKRVHEAEIERLRQRESQLTRERACLIDAHLHFQGVEVGSLPVLIQEPAPRTDAQLPDPVIAWTLDRFQEKPGWALNLPEDLSTFHTGSSAKAQQFQEVMHQTVQLGWSTTHMCLMQVIARMWSDLPRRYLEIGVCEGLSVLALVTAIRFQKALRRQNILEPFFDELVLADFWGNQFGGSARGSHQHVEELLRSVHVTPDQVTFLDGDSKKTVPAYLRSRKNHVPFDAVFVDGDHSYHGAMTDLENVLPYVGKVLFFDDIYHPAHCLRDRLLEVHRSLVKRLKDDFYVFVNRSWFGFAAFIRKDVFDALP